MSGCEDECVSSSNDAHVDAVDATNEIAGNPVDSCTGENEIARLAQLLVNGPAADAVEVFARMCGGTQAGAGAKVAVDASLDVQPHDQPLGQAQAACIARECAARFWDEPARFWRLIGKSPFLKSSSDQVKTIGLCYFRLGIGGAERVVAFLANLWVSMGYQVVLFCDEDPTDEDYDIPVSVKRVKLPLFLEANAANYGNRAELLTQAIQTYQVDLMVYHQWLSHALAWDMLACKLLNVPFVLFTHGVYGCMYRWDNRWEIQLPVVAGYAEGVVALDEIDARFWREHCPRVWQTANPITIAPDATKASTLDNQTIVWAGRLDPGQKQPAEALEVMALVLRDVPDAKLLMVGPAPNQQIMDDLIALAEHLGISSSVVFTGPKKDISPYLESASVYLSTSCLEGWYLTLAESMACGLPSVAYELPYLTLLQGECGCVQVAQGDRAGAARALVGLLESKEERKRLGAQAFAKISDIATFNYEDFWTGVFSQVVSEPVPARNSSADAMWDIMLQANLHAIDDHAAILGAAVATGDRASQACNQAQQHANELENSTSYKVGRAIMALPCKVKDILSKHEG